jgi:MFS superfamily sulfate permease-like transporter
MIAFLLSLVDVIRRASRPETSALLEAPDGSHFLPAGAGDAHSSSGLVVYRFGAPLYFANSTLFLDEVEQLLARTTTPVRWFVLDAEAMVDIDTTGEQVLHQVLTWLANRGVTVAVSRANQPTTALLAHYHLMKLIGKDRLYPTNRHAIAAFRQETGQATQAGTRQT